MNALHQLAPRTDPLRTATEAFDAQVRLELTRRRPSDPELTGVGPRGIAELFDQLERRTRFSLWSMQWTYRFDPEGASWELDRRSRRRGVEMSTVVTPTVLRTNPLLSSIEPEVRVAPVYSRLLIIDGGEAVVVAAPPTPDGLLVLRVLRQRQVVEAALRLWRETLRRSVPVLAEGEEPPLNRRQIEVARLACLGRKDAAIARELNMSARSVSRDLVRVIEVVGASSRSEAVLNIVGARMDRLQPHGQTCAGSL